MADFEDFSERYKAYPDRSKPPFEMSDVNEDIQIHTGEYEISSATATIRVDGDIWFAWFPIPQVKFNGKVLSGFTSFADFDGTLQLKVDRLLVGEPSVSVTQSLVGVTVEGDCSDAVWGDKSIGVTKATFVLLNMREYSWDTIKDITPEKASVYSGRIAFDDDQYFVHIDIFPDYRKLVKRVELKGGYLILYSGEILPKKGALTYSDLKDYVACLNQFIFFFCGRRYPAYFLTGIFEGEKIWSDYTGYITEMYQFIPSWSHMLNKLDLTAIWRTFLSLWRTPEDRDFIEILVHWYIEANGQAAFVDGSIILAQTALELLYNWLLVENAKVVIGPDADNLSAANKIRLLLTYVRAPLAIPAAFSELSALDGATDGPQIFVQIRNALVHGQEKKRVELMKVSDRAKYQALQLGLWYIELLFLYILGYNGKYRNRTSGDSFALMGETVPWAR